MYRKLFFLAGLVLASTAQAQTPYGTIMRHIAVDYAIAETPRGTATGPVDEAVVHPASFDAPIDGSRALLGNGPSALPDGAGDAERPSSFRAEVRGDVTGNAWGDAEFGTIHAIDQSSVTFVLSLGVCGDQSAVLFTRRSGAPLAVGRYRISEGATGADEITALVLTGSPTRPTGVFRGESGWLVVTAASDRLTTGEFQIEATGFVAADPQHEDRQVNVTGSFSATTGSSSFRVCESSE